MLNKCQQTLEHFPKSVKRFSEIALVSGRSFLILVFIIALASVFPLSVRAIEPDEVLSDPHLEMRARAISRGLRCLVCVNETIDDSQAPLARDLRQLVRERLKQGESDAEIVDFIAARYGEFVLLRPPFTLKTAALWLSPWLILAAIMGVVLYRITRARETREG